jgi:two-component system sensor histidine kinase DesK
MPAPQDDPITKHKGIWWRLFFSAIWLVYLAYPVSQLFGHRHSALYIAGGLALVAVFCVIYVYLLFAWDRLAVNPYGWLAAMAVVAAVTSVVYDGGALWIYVSSSAGAVIKEERQAFRTVLAVTVAYAVFGLIKHVDTTDFLVNLVPTMLVGLAMIGFRRQLELNRELTRAREAVARLAASEERLRLARDMHDLTGQSLSMITLKSELAGKRLSRLPASAERDAVLGELDDIGRVSRQTLQDIREAVSGYRRPTLAVEVITARHALDAAGIRLDDDPALTLRSGTFDPDAEAALAWCLREAATNVIRHSGASHCWLRLAGQDGELALEVLDDGRGLPGQDESAGGSGLRGMSERLDAVGGRLSLGVRSAADRGGLCLRATVPAAPVPSGPTGSPAPVPAGHNHRP